MITLYGATPTRATRPQWMLEELRLKYEHVREPDLESASFRALNPGDAFTVADVNVASIAILTRFAVFDNAGFPNVLRWLDACFARPAAQRSRL